YSPDGARLAYVPFTNTRAFPGSYIAWKKYRGGSAPFIWIADLKTSAVEKIPHTDANDFNPMWVGSQGYFLSDRDGSTTLYAYNTTSREIQCVLPPNGSDIKSAAACDEAIVFDRLDGLYVYELSSGKAHPLDVKVRGDLPGVRPRVEKVG